jgi:hypothetical protein
MDPCLRALSARYSLTFALPPRFQTGISGWLIAAGFVMVPYAICRLAGVADAAWPALLFAAAALLSLRYGWGPAGVALCLSAACLTGSWPVPAETVKFGSEICRDLFGLFGAILTALAFFRLEMRKKEAQIPRIVDAPQPDLNRVMQAVAAQLDRRVLEPNDIDAQLTFWGLMLISASFLISIALTIAQHYRLFGN